MPYVRKQINNEGSVHIQGASPAQMNGLDYKSSNENEFFENSCKKRFGNKLSICGRLSSIGTVSHHALNQFSLIRQV